MNTTNKPSVQLNLAGLFIATVWIAIGPVAYNEVLADFLGQQRLAVGIPTFLLLAVVAIAGRYIGAGLVIASLIASHAIATAPAGATFAITVGSILGGPTLSFPEPIQILVLGLWVCAFSHPLSLLD